MFYNCLCLFAANGLHTQLTHPFGIMHGGELRFADWEARYEEVTKELEKIENRPVDETGVPVNGMYSIPSWNLRYSLMTISRVQAPLER